MIEVLTLLFQLVILAGLGWINWNLWGLSQMTRRTDSLIREYRREIGWLTARLDAVEQQVRRRPPTPGGAPSQANVS